MACGAVEGEDIARSQAALDLGGWEPVSNALGSPPNFAQLGNGSTMSVVSAASDPEVDRRGAKAGALVELFYPHYADDNLWDSYIGIRVRGAKLRWAHDLTLLGQKIVPDTGQVVSEFSGALDPLNGPAASAGSIELRLEDVVRPANDAHVRHVVVKNVGTRTLEDVDVAFYAFYTLRTLPTGDSIRFDDATGALVQVDGSIAVATIGDRLPLKSHCGEVLNFLGGAAQDARLALEGDSLVACQTRGATPQGVNGALVHRLSSLAPGETKDISYAIGLGPTADKALAEAAGALSGGFAARANEDKARWAKDLERAKIPNCLPAEAKDIYRRAIVTILQHRVDNGAFIAAPTLTSPGYRFIWPRDGSKTAVDLLAAGFDVEAANFFELLEKLLLPDGSFAVNYIPDASKAFFDFGADGNENDQPGMLPWGVDKVYAKTKDKAWLAARWNGVKAASDHLLAILDADGLVAPSRDLWELETGKTWTYSNGAALAGLEAASRLATAAGFISDATRYEDGAARVRGGITSKLVTTDGYYARGKAGSTLDNRVEIGNLALGVGGFGLFDDTEPALAKVGDLVAQRLADPNGGVRRYEGDQYYGGQQWPVAAVWLALHRQARGDRASAESVFKELTRQARTSASLMLGEQFKASSDKWIGAIPLVWSEATYVRLAWALYGCDATSAGPPEGKGAESPSDKAAPRPTAANGPQADTGCGCRTVTDSTERSWLALGALAAGLTVLRRREARRPD